MGQDGVDGRDYAVTGTWGVTASSDPDFQNGAKAYFWDVTDPTDMKRIGEVQVDARTVNDVKVSEDGTLCIISREGASNRRLNHVGLDRQVVVDEVRRPCVVGLNSAHRGGGQNDPVGPRFRDPILGLRLAAQIGNIPAGGQDLAILSF